MVKRKGLSIVMLLMLLGLFFVCVPVSANSGNITGDTNYQESVAPDRIQGTAFYFTYQGGSVFKTASAMGHVYRGNLFYVGIVNGDHKYSGWLYRHPLPYPMSVPEAS